jgi:outer membrane receptor protein involved in Fe transport
MYGYDELEFKGETGRNLDTHYLASQYFIKPQVKYNYKENSYIIIGGDYKDGKSEDKLIPSNKDKKRESYAGYILNKTTVGDWQFTQGYRREKIKYDTEIKEGYGKPILGTKESHNADSFELGVNYLYSDTGSIYLSYVNGFRSPSIQDMGAWKGNIKLQSTENYEFGIKDMYKNTYASASVFLINTKDEIYLEKTIDDTFGTNKNFDGWIDVFETENKRSGAYSLGIYDVHPYVLLNYQGTMDDVFTVAHEMGHAMHSTLSSEAQPYATHDYTIFVAEVASTFNERLMLDYMIKNSDDSNEKIALKLNYSFLLEQKQHLFVKVIYK